MIRFCSIPNRGIWCGIDPRGRGIWFKGDELAQFSWNDLHNFLVVWDQSRVIQFLTTIFGSTLMPPMQWLAQFSEAVFVMWVTSLRMQFWMQIWAQMTCTIWAQIRAQVQNDDYSGVSNNRALISGQQTGCRFQMVWIQLVQILNGQFYLDRLHCTLWRCTIF